MPSPDVVNGVILEETLPYKKYKYHRVVRVYENDDLVFLQEVRPGERPPDSAMPRPESLSGIRRRLGKDLREVKECIRPASMQTTLTDEEHIACEERMGELYAFLWDDEANTVNEESLRLVLSKKSRRELVMRFAEQGGVALAELYRTITRFCWFGCTLSGFLPLDEWKGPRGSLFTAGKAGPVPAGARIAKRIREAGYDIRLSGLSRKERDPGRSCPSHYEARILDALKTHWVNSRLPMIAVYELFVREHFNAGVRTPNKQEIRKYKWHSVLTMRQFRRRANILIEKHNLRSAREGAEESIQKNRARHGKASSLAISACDIYDMDGTEFDFELSSSPERFRPCGRPTVLIAIDRFSGAIVGFFDWMGAEKSDAYLMLAFSAFTPKSALLEALGLPLNSWQAYGVPRGVFLDRGPACMSKATKTGFCRRTGIARIVAPPRRGDAKPHVESVFDKLRNALSWMPGSWVRPKTRKDADQWKFARANAYLTPSGFRELLVRAIIDYNNARFTPQNKTRDMRNVKIETTPEQIFLFSKGEIRGDANIEWSPQVVFSRLLNAESVTVSADGIHVKNRRYIGNGLADVFNSWKESASDRRTKPKILAAPIPFISSCYAWLKGPDDIVYLHESNEDHVGLQSVSHEEDNALHQYDLAEERVNEVTRASKSLVRTEQQKIIEQSVGINVSTQGRRTGSKQGVSAEKKRVLRTQSNMLGQEIGAMLGIPGMDAPTANPPNIRPDTREASSLLETQAASANRATNHTNTGAGPRPTTRGPTLAELYALRGKLNSRSS
ncbi:hypothetical protein BN2475_580055 [Paraburkholderia ribeironis]|uniref:Integrase catalytic domain-containing protein n=1 Tax=Paraburkholderia ribeironis TaxID=1247936 RepID=A0A1N7SE48_9BURK|nr:hypothetical protein [Paraburkholderia ribeironis]SIT45698.1 hypothetical protein BN2475_580055 [Paraburkholderia ribeironis]